MTPSVSRIPFFFGPTDTPLFGWRHHSTADLANGIGVILCPPLGHEFVHSYRALRHLADDLAAAGVEVLRLDYHGTGNSSGVDEDPQRVNAWLASIEHAITLLRATPALTQVGLVGVRIGAILAAHSAARSAVDFLVAWSPILKGRDFVRELRAVQRTGEQFSTDPHITDGAIEAAGFIYTAATQDALSALDMLAVVPAAERVLWIARDDLAEDAAALNAWRTAGFPLEEKRLPGVAEMLLPAHDSVVPQAAISTIVRWIVGKTARCAAPINVDRGAAQARLRGQFYCADNTPSFTYDVKEELWQMGERPALFGILCTPAQTPQETTRPVIVLLNAGAVHHIGPHRLYVLLARSLAQQGFSCLRMDVSGKGDSDAAPGRAENIVYSPRAVADIAQALTALQQRLGAQRFVLAGLCSGAHDAFHAATQLDAPIVEALMLNPLTFYWQEGMSLAAAPSRQYSHWAHYMRSLRQWSRWKKLLRGKVSFRKIAQLITQRVGMRLGVKTAPAITPSATSTISAPREDLAADLRKIAARHTGISFFIAETDPGYDILMTTAGRAVKQLQRAHALSIERVPQANHTFTSRTARRGIIARVTEHLQNAYGPTR